MGLIANGRATPQEQKISANGFFPEISVDEIRDIVKVDGSVTDARVKQTIFEEILDVNRLLASLVQPNTTLVKQATQWIGEKSDKEILYFSAVSNGVSAKVCEKYRGYDSTNAGNKRAEDLTSTIDEYRRNKHWAIQQLLQQNQTTVELI
ncbi:head completion/stabilization protein [Acinetobacter sp. HY1485]|uniref:head completion/stabilization protein n=1 Tax=Acinetobacter sp. HY1485 TaxID=2970918 RepID=UPI0022B98F7B|nr:head completion/stabilization protein [Acinetobacter sp. HY1485]